MSIIIGPDGSLVNTSNVGSQFIPNITPNIGALANVASVGGSTIPKGVENEDGTFTIPNIEMRVRSTGLEPGQLQNMYGITGDQGVPMFEFLSPVQTGTTTFDPEDDNLMSDKNLDKIKDNFDGADPPPGSAQGQDLARAAQASAGIFGATVGSSLGNAYVGMRNQQLPVLPGNEFTGTDVVKAGVNSVVPFGKTSDVEKTGIDYTGGGDVYDRAFGDRAMANFTSSAIVGGSTFVGRVVAGQDPMDAAEDAAKVGLAYYIGNAVAGETGGKVASWITNLFV
jgi:hypothetical protein